MKLTNFGIRNYRSFDEKGIHFQCLNKINVFIGKNNSGKSNILRFIKRLQSISTKVENNFSLEDEFRRNGNTPVLIVKLNLKDLIDKNFIKDTSFDIEINLQSKQISFDISVLEKYSQSELLSMQNFYQGAFSTSDPSPNVLLKQIKSDIEKKIKSKLPTFFKEVHYIPQYRQITEFEHEENSDFNGNNIISLLFKMQNPDIGYENDREKFNNIQNFVRQLLKNESLKIEIPNTKDKIIVEMDEVRLSIESFGTGLHQLVILCSALEIYQNCIFCIEEPEIHLHPELQRQFIEFLKKTNNTYFITTHSNVFLDYDDNVTIYHVKYDGVKSAVSYIDNTSSNHDILNDLGYRNSDIIQANGIIWVEGPSDRVYINHWIKLKNPKLIEGLHYSIMFYGGRLLSNLTYDTDNINEHLIPLLKINRNAYVVIDKDGAKITDKLSQTKERIQKEIGNDKCWITQGREIENYLSESTINKWLKEKHNISIQFKHSKHKKLEETISKLNKSNNIKYNLNKNGYSKEIIKYIQEEDLDIFDLSTRINEIIKLIGIWNS